MKKFYFFFLFIFLPFLFVKAQTKSYNIEIFMHTANTAGNTVIFDVISYTEPIWNPEINKIGTENFTNPASLTIIGNDTTTLKGWLAYG